MNENDIPRSEDMGTKKDVLKLENMKGSQVSLVEGDSLVFFHLKGTRSREQEPSNCDIILISPEKYQDGKFTNTGKNLIMLATLFKFPRRVMRVIQPLDLLGEIMEPVQINETYPVNFFLDGDKLNPIFSIGGTDVLGIYLNAAGDMNRVYTNLHVETSSVLLFLCSILHGDNQLNTQARVHLDRLMAEIAPTEGQLVSDYLKAAFDYLITKEAELTFLPEIPSVLN